MLALAHERAQGLDNVVDIGGSFPACGDTRRAWEAWCVGAVHIVSVCRVRNALCAPGH